MTDPGVAALAARLIKKYYSGVTELPLAHLERREFGFGEFGKKISYRHYSFRSFGELKRYLVESAAPFVSYSVAEYQRPEARPIEMKGLIGAELVFDLDANDLKLPCSLEHGTNLVCQKCLDAVKGETLRLVEDFLVPDFGISKDEITVNFSGNRGYHVHVSNDKVFGLDSAARRELSGYISPAGIDPAGFFPTLGMRATALHGPKPTDGGWGGKIARTIITALNSGPEALIALGIPKETARKLIRNRANVLLGITTGNWDKVNIPRKAEFWTSVINQLAIKQSNSIDRNVTNDVKHLIRLPNTIHGDTGLLAKTIPLTALSGFDPMREAIVFRGSEVLVKTGKVPRFSMDGRQFGPYENQRIGLPMYAGLYLMLKGLALLGS